MGRNFFTGNVGSAMEAFRAGKYAEAEKLISEHEAITKTQFGIGRMQLQQGQLQLQRERFGQVEQPLAQASIASTEESITSSKQVRELQGIKIDELNKEIERQAMELAELKKLTAIEDTTPAAVRAGVSFSQQKAAKTTTDVTTEFAREREQVELDAIKAKADASRATELAKRSPEQVLRDNLLLTGDFDKKTINKIIADIGLQKGGILLSVSEVGRMLTTLRTARANIENQASIGDLMKAVETESGISSTKLTALQTMLGASQRPIRTAADRDRASRILQTYENIIIQQQADRPIQQFTNTATGQPTPGQEATTAVFDAGTGETGKIPIPQFQEQISDSPEINDAINRVIDAKKAAGSGKLTPVEEAQLREKGLSQFIDIINIRIQER